MGEALEERQTQEKADFQRTVWLLGLCTRSIGHWYTFKKHMSWLGVWVSWRKHATAEAFAQHA